MQIRIMRIMCNTMGQCHTLKQLLLWNPESVGPGLEGFWYLGKPSHGIFSGPLRVDVCSHRSSIPMAVTSYDIRQLYLQEWVQWCKDRKFADSGVRCY